MIIFKLSVLSSTHLQVPRQSPNFIIVSIHHFIKFITQFSHLLLQVVYRLNVVLLYRPERCLKGRFALKQLIKGSPKYLVHITPWLLILICWLLWCQLIYLLKCHAQSLWIYIQLLVYFLYCFLGNVLWLQDFSIKVETFQSTQSLIIHICDVTLTTWIFTCIKSFIQPNLQIRPLLGSSLVLGYFNLRQRMKFSLFSHG